MMATANEPGEADPPGRHHGGATDESPRGPLRVDEQSGEDDPRDRRDDAAAAARRTAGSPIGGASRGRLTGSGVRRRRSVIARTRATNAAATLTAIAALSGRCAVQPTHTVSGPS